MPIVGRIDCEIQSYKYTWQFDDFKLRHLEPGEKLRSPKFEATFNGKEFEWQIRLSLSEVKGSETVTIALYTFSTNVVTANVSFGFVDTDNKVVQIMSTNKQRHDMRHKSEAIWAIPSFTHKSFISRDNNLIHGFSKVIIECEIHVYATCAKEREKKELLEIEQDNVLRFEEFDKYEHLLNNDAFSDVSFVVEGKILKAHKCILAKSSPVFTAMFQHEMREKRENLVRINDMQYNVFFEMLRFVYAGKISLYNYGVKSTSEELLFAADKYSIDGLKEKCVKLICDDLCIDNAVDILMLANRHEVQYLKFRAMKLIVLHSYELNEIPYFELLISTPNILYEVCHAIASHGKFLKA
ncbi:speckle-type POZ protein B-like [Nasonia vitripennis]|uniref:BTB domain-containing protein n=1 Tax=Nasonia vitripennis TaxID=7425 RepID=A0A7M7LRV5_NASVI|nr:speckle-type POZ protein B-like [Nasonia vitripennis]